MIARADGVTQISDSLVKGTMQVELEGRGLVFHRPSR
jgi:hypothetical protein